MDAWLYPLVKSVHIFAVISWMAGMLYLPRLFVYHAEVAPGSDAASTFEVMERRLLRGIMNPTMIITLISGLWLAWHWWPQHWLMVKFLFVLPIFALHMYCARWRRAFAEGRNTHSSRFYRIVNEVPAVAMLVIIPLVVFKAF